MRDYLKNLLLAKQNPQSQKLIRLPPIKQKELKSATPDQELDFSFGNDQISPALLDTLPLKTQKTQQTPIRIRQISRKQRKSRTQRIVVKRKQSAHFVDLQNSAYSKYQPLSKTFSKMPGYQISVCHSHQFKRAKKRCKQCGLNLCIKCSKLHQHKPILNNLRAPSISEIQPNYDKIFTEC